MAEAQAKNLVETPPVSTANDADDQPLAAALIDYLQRYTPPEPPTKDVVAGRYRVDTASPLSDYNTKTATAYSAVDLMDGSKSLFALVCQHGTVQRQRALQMLRSIEHPHLLTLCAADVVHLTQLDEQRFVLIYIRPPGQKLSTLLASTSGALNESFISKNILGPIISAIGQMAELGIPHGSIRPDNIYYKDYPVLGDCISEPCGYSQPFYFESIERLQTSPAGQGEGNISQDYYALAILTLYMLYGPNHFNGLSEEMLTRRILHEGAYNTLLRNREPPEAFNDLLRGLLSGNINERWNFRNLKQWIDGKRSNIMLPTLPSESLRPFEFAGTQCSTKKELAHVLYKNWPLMQEMMHTDQLIQWVTVSLRNKELAETLKRIKRVVIETSVKNEIQISEQLMRMLLLFDPAGPIRINNLCFNLDGIHSLYVELYNNKAINELKLLNKFIEHSMSNHWMDMQSYSQDSAMPESINATNLKLDRLRLFIRNTGPGFGNERTIYELNPEMPCLSPLFYKRHADNVLAVLTYLDRMASRLFKEQDPLDPHIAAFIANRLGVLHDIKLHELIPHPSLATDSSMLALKLISMAQSKCGDVQFPGLCHWLALRILPRLNIIKSKSLRSRLKALMVERAKTGYTQLMAELVLHSNYPTIDLSGFGRASQTYRHNIEMMAHYRKEEVIESHSVRLGHMVATFFAYLVFILAIYKSWGMK